MMSRSSRVSLLAALFLVLVGVPVVRAQGNPVQTDGWQGPRPTPQQRSLSPAPQPSTPSPVPQQPLPSGKQVLEIPSHPQQPNPDLPKQQAAIPPRPQVEPARPSQLLVVTVTDQQGRYVPGLQPEDFLVYEEDLPQKITYFNTGQKEPVSVGLLVDMSGSMLHKLGRARAAVRRFVDTIQARDEVFLEAFNDHPVLLQDFTDSPSLLTQATSQLEPLGETALYDAILDGLRRVQQGRCQKKALVVLTDGLDTASAASLSQVLDAIRRAGILVYTIGIGDPARAISLPRGGMYPPTGGLNPSLGGLHGGGMRLPMGPSVGSRGSGLIDIVDSQTLQTVSDETGAKHFLLNTAQVMGNGAVLDEAVQTISNELRQQYSVGYNSPLKGDVYRSVRVEPRREGLVVRTRKGSE